MLVLQARRLLKGGGYLRYRHLFLHLLAMCAQNCMKGGGWGVKEPRKAGMEQRQPHNKDSWKDCSGKKCVRSFTSRDARLRLFKGSSPAERLLSSQHCNKGTATALFVRLECSRVLRGSTRTTNPRLHQGRERGANLSQTPDREAKHCRSDRADKHFTLFSSRSDSTKGSSLPNCLWVTPFDVALFLKRLCVGSNGPVTKRRAGSEQVSADRKQVYPSLVQTV